MIKALIWNEFYHEQCQDAVEIRKNYPQGIHNYLKEVLKGEFSVRTATLYDENCGITKEILDDTDVMLWWGHCRHNDVPDSVAQMVRDAVLRGMGIIFLHSAHMSKPFRLLMGTSCTLGWRENGDKERLWTVNRSHPIAKNIPEEFTLPHEEVYCEPFGIPEPDETVFIGWFEGGEVFRSGCCWKRENGKVFYFQPGHETYPTYQIPEVCQIIKNAIIWCSGEYKAKEITCPNITPPKD